MDEVIDPKVLRDNIASNVRRLRLARELSQESLAGLIGVTRVHIVRIETGKNTPSADVLFALADVLGVSSDSLRQVA